MSDEQGLNSAFGNADNIHAQYDAPQAQDYLADMTGEDYGSLSQAEKIELLESLFVIMKSFVNLGYGLDPVNKLIGEFQTSSEQPVAVIDYEDATDEE